MDVLQFLSLISLHFDILSGAAVWFQGYELLFSCYELNYYCQRTPTLDGFMPFLFWIFDHSFWLFDYSFWLFDYRVKYSKFLLAVETWFLLLEIIFVILNKVLDTTNNQMLISNIWILRTNNVSNNQILIFIILIIRPSLAFVGSKSTYPHSFIRSMTIQLVWVIIAVNSNTLTILTNVIWIILHLICLWTLLCKFSFKS